MLEFIGDFLRIFQFITALGYLAAIYFALKLFEETDKGWYWLSLVLSAFFFALSQWTVLLFPFSLLDGVTVAFIQEFSKFAAGIFFALACYGMYSTMVEIRKRVE